MELRASAKPGFVSAVLRRRIDRACRLRRRRQRCSGVQRAHGRLQVEQRGDGRRQVGIATQRRVEVHDRLRVVRLDRGIGQLLALEVEPVRLGIAGFQLFGRCHRSGRQPRVERPGDGSGHFRLHGEHVLDVLVVRIRPDVRVRSGINEGGDDAHVIALHAHAAFQHRAHTQFTRDLRDVLVRVLVAHHRGAADHAQSANLTELRDDILGDALRDVVVLRVRRHVGEGQHGHGCGGHGRVEQCQAQIRAVRLSGWRASGHRFGRGRSDHGDVP